MKFFERRQDPDESARRYLEEKAHLVRRARLGFQPFILHGMMEGLRAEFRREVMLQRPTTLESLLEAADVANAIAMTIQVVMPDSSLQLSVVFTNFFF